MEIKDLVGFSKPLEKLVDVVAKGVGGFYKPYLIRKNADAKAYEIRQLADANKYKMEQDAQALHEAQQLLGNVEFTKGKLIVTNPSTQAQLSLPERIEDRKKYQEAKEQQNIEDITSIAAEELANEENVSSEPVEDDWIARFFDAARLISDEQMQALWGKILAGEVSQPHSYSLRTLDVLRNLSKAEAETFVKVAKIAVRDQNFAFVINPDSGKYLNDNFDITFLDLLSLSELGLISQQDLKLNYEQFDVPSMIIFRFAKVAVILERPAGDPRYGIAIKKFTSIGTELASLVSQEINNGYLHEFMRLLKQNNSIVKYGKIIRLIPNGVEHDNLQEFDADKPIEVLI